MTVTIRIPGRFCRGPLQEAVRMLTGREPSLRTVNAELEVDFVPGGGPDLPNQLAAFVAAPFALDGGPLVRVRVFQDADGDVLCLVAHDRACTDAVSAQAMLDELIALHERLCAHRPDAELSAEILRIWRQVLDRPELEEDADFFLNGGQSLIAARLLQQVRRLVGFRIPLEVLLSAPTPQTFTERLLGLRDKAEQP